MCTLELYNWGGAITSCAPCNYTVAGDGVDWHGSGWLGGGVLVCVGG